MLTKLYPEFADYRIDLVCSHRQRKSGVVGVMVTKPDGVTMMSPLLDMYKGGFSQFIPWLQEIFFSASEHHIRATILQQHEDQTRGGMNHFLAPYPWTMDPDGWLMSVDIQTPADLAPDQFCLLDTRWVDHDSGEGLLLRMLSDSADVGSVYLDFLYPKAMLLTGAPIGKMTPFGLVTVRCDVITVATGPCVAVPVGLLT